MWSHAARYLSRTAAIALVVLAVGCANDPPPEPLSPLTALASQDMQLLRLWRSDIGKPGRGRFELAKQDEVLFAANGEGRVMRIDATSGIARWRRQLKAEIVSGVTLADEQLYVALKDGQIEALSADQGETLWTASSSSEVLAPLAAGFGAVVVRSGNGQIRVLEPGTGDERWSVSYSPPALTVYGQGVPLLVPQGVLVGLDDGSVVALNLGTGKVFWESTVSLPSGRSEVERMVDIDADIVTDNQALYAASYQGRLARIEPVRGQMQWSVPMSTIAGLVLGERELYVVDEKSSVHAYDKQTGQLMWTQDALSGRQLGAPAIADGRLFIGDGGGLLHVLDASSGELVARQRVAGDEEAIAVRPLIDEQVVYTLGRKGTLAAWRYATL